MERILLLGYFGAGNFGDDALLADWLNRRADWLARQELAVDITSAGNSPVLGSFAEADKLEALIDRCLPRRDTLSVNPHNYRALIAPGGSLLQDSTSLKSLLYYLSVISRFSKAGRPVFLLNQGLGPFHSWLANFLTPRTLRRLKMLSLRDRESHRWTTQHRALKDHAALLLSSDPMLAPSLAAPEPNQRFADYLLVIPRPTGDLPHPGDTTEEHEALAKYVVQLTELSGLRPLFLPLHAGQDAVLCSEAARLIEGAEVYEPEPGELTGTSYLGLVANAGLVLSHRLHGLITAAAYGVPAIGVAYDPKVSAFATEIGYPYAFPATLHLADAQADAERLWANREEVRIVANERCAEMVSRYNRSEQRFDEIWD